MTLRVHGAHRRAIPLSETIEAWILIAGLVGAVWLLKSHIIASVVAGLGEYTEIGAFVSGLFFTSMLTTVPAIVALSEVSHYMPIWHLALLGGLGALMGDLLIFRFVRSGLVERIVRAACSPRMQRFGRAIAAGPPGWMPTLIGAVVIASPLPDEVGLLMMGLSNIRLLQFVPLSLIANTAGIYLIAIATQTLVT